MNNETATRYLGFLQTILGASNCKKEIVPDHLHRVHRISTYAYTALKDLGYISVMNNVTRGPQVPVWELNEHPDKTHAIKLFNAVSKLHNDAYEQRQARIKTQQATKMKEPTSVTLTVNGTKLTLPVIDKTISFEVDGDKIEIVLAE